MSEEKESRGKSKINYKKLNEMLKISHNVLKIFYVLAIIVCIYVVLKVCQELKILNFVLDILAILSPLFMGLAIAWLFNPVVTFLKKKGIKRVFGVSIIYVLFLGVISLIVGSILPILYDQIISFAGTVPSIFNGIESTLDEFLGIFSDIEGINVESIKNAIINQLEALSDGITSGVSSYIVNIAKALISGISSFVVGLVIGFFFLLSYDNIGDTVHAFVPKKWKSDVNKLTSTIDGSLRNYVVGVLIDATVIFAICSIAFGLIGLRAPLLFAVFCAITNVIPYVGPYIGAVPALIVAFSMSPTIGILTLIAIVVIQFFEGNFLQEYIMSKTTKLHPVTIIMGLLIFGHYWGIIGMVLSTPLIAVFKQIWIFLDEKYDFFNSRSELNE